MSLSSAVQLAVSFDGAVIGVALAYAAVRALLKFRYTSAALLKIRGAPSTRVGDLSSVIHRDDAESSDEPVIFVRGTVGVNPVAVGGSWKSPRYDVLVSQRSGDNAVIIQSLQTCVYSQWKGFLGWTYDFYAVLGISSNKQDPGSLRTVPFALVGDQQCLLVNLDNSRHPLPLTTVYHKLQPINASPFTFLQAVFGYEYPVGLLDQEKILPLGKEISAVGILSLNEGAPEIKSCKELPYFLSEMSKDQMILELAVTTKTLWWSGIVLVSISSVIIGYAAVRNWNKWKERRHQRQFEQQREDANDDVENDDETDDAQLCVICLVRRRRYAFTPCGHLVCCRRCTRLVERSTKCPVCFQKIHNAVRIYGA